MNFCLLFDRAHKVGRFYAGEDEASTSLEEQRTTVSVLISTVRKRSCGKVMFLHLSVSYYVHEGVHQCMLGYMPQADTPRQTLPQADTPPGTHPLWVDTPLGRYPLPSECWHTHTPLCPVHAGIHTPPITTPLPRACCDRHGYCCGQYASYWNTFVFIFPSLFYFYQPFWLLLFLTLLFSIVYFGTMTQLYPPICITTFC